MRVKFPIPTGPVWGPNPIAITKTLLQWALGAILAICLCSAAIARSSSQEEEELLKLKADVQELKTQQQQILDGLDEIKKLVAKGGGPPGINPPAAMSVKGEPFRGETAASVAIIEYADFQCPFCKHFEHDAYPPIRDAYISTGKARYYFRDLPLPFHEHAMPAARAARCADEQGQYWQMHDSLFADQASLTPTDIDERAGKLGLDVAKLDACVASNRYADVIRRNMTEANQMRIGGTPTFLIGVLDANGDVVSIKKTVIGANPFEAFKAAIDPLLDGAKGSIPPVAQVDGAAARQ